MVHHGQLSLCSYLPKGQCSRSFSLFIKHTVQSYILISSENYSPTCNSDYAYIANCTIIFFLLYYKYFHLLKYFFLCKMINLKYFRNLLSQHLFGKSEVLKHQPKDIGPPVCPGSSPGPPTEGTCLKHLMKEAFNDQAPHHISNELPSHPANETHFLYLYLVSLSLGHDQ